MASDWERIERAAMRYGRVLDPIAARYRNPRTGQRLSGQALILKTIKGESGAKGDAVSSAGARGWAQFMPGTRAEAVQKFGVDPWKSPEDAVHALTLHMRGKLGHNKGLEGYNPGGGSEYVSYILGQEVGAPRGGLSRPKGARAPEGTSDRAGSLASSLASSPISQGAPVELTPRPQIQSAGVQLPEALTPQGYLGTPSSGPPAPPPPMTLDVPQGMDVDLGGEPRQPGAAGGGRDGGGGDGREISGGYPLSKRGKVIGVPHAGTHTIGNWQSDNAVDIAVPDGTGVAAMDDGVVEKVKGGYSGGASRFDGFQVTIRFRNGNRAFYTHLSKAGVKAGQKVKRGQMIGRSGSANGVPHLHLGVEKGDPRKLIG